jgi:hypothetical protein
MAAPTRDHIVPRSKGGTLAPGNQALACDAMVSGEYKGYGSGYVTFEGAVTA